VLVAGPGPRYGPPVLERDADGVRLALTDHMVLPLEVARNAAPKMRRCRLRCSEINSRSAGTSCGRSFRSAASSGPRIRWLVSGHGFHRDPAPAGRRTCVISVRRALRAAT
jgi:hypothetical protein